MELSLFFAGTAGSVPTARRGLPALLVRAGGDRLLFDCGEGTQQQLLRSVGLPELDAVFLTHFHLDHWLGLLGMVKTFDLRARERPLSLYGPPGLRALIEGMRPDHRPHGLPARGRGARAARGGRVRRLPRRAPSPSITASPRSATRWWRTIAPAASTRAPRAPWGSRTARTSAGCSAGRRSAGSGPSRSSARRGAGRRIVLSGDTRPCQTTEVYAHEADVLVHEATFLEEERARARQTAHSTAGQAAEIAARGRRPAARPHPPLHALLPPRRARRGAGDLPRHGRAARLRRDRRAVPGARRAGAGQGGPRARRGRRRTERRGSRAPAPPCRSVGLTLGDVEQSRRRDVLLAAVCFGTTGTAQALGPSAAPSRGSRPDRVGGALLLLVARRCPAPPRVAAAGAGLIAVAIAVYQLAFFAAVERTGVAVGTVVALGSAPASRRWRAAGRPRGARARAAPRHAGEPAAHRRGARDGRAAAPSTAGRVALELTSPAGCAASRSRRCLAYEPLRARAGRAARRRDDARRAADRAGSASSRSASGPAPSRRSGAPGLLPRLPRARGRRVGSATRRRRRGPRAHERPPLPRPRLDRRRGRRRAAHPHPRRRARRRGAAARGRARRRLRRRPPLAARRAPRPRRGGARRDRAQPRRDAWRG